MICSFIEEMITEKQYMFIFQLLGSGERVKSIEGYQNVTSPCYSGVTDSPGNGTVDIIFSDHSLANMPGSTSYVGFSPDTENLTPLQVNIKEGKRIKHKSLILKCFFVIL